MDLQCVLMSPSLQASALYYRTKLCVHNFTVFDCVTRDTDCYVWHEFEGGLSAHEFASCVYKYLCSDTSYDTYIIYSDGCTYQNRNATMAKAISRFAQKFEKTVYQKFLVRGHTQMEVDSVHSTIERALKGKPVYCPADYVRYIGCVRQVPHPYVVHYLDYSFFLDFSNICSLKSIRPGRASGDPHVTHLRALRYSPDGDISYQLSLDTAWASLPKKRGETTEQQNDPTPLHTQRRKLAAAKYQHLQELKSVIPADYHLFYDTLPHV